MKKGENELKADGQKGEGEKKEQDTEETPSS